MTFCTRRLPRLCLVALLVFLILVAILTLSARIALPFLAYYKPTLEGRLSEFLKSPVTIAELDARWEGAGPVLRARGVQISDPMSRQAQFDELLIDLNVPRSIMSGSAVMDELTLVGVDLVLDYSRERGVELHGVTRGNSRNAENESTSGSSKNRNRGFDALAWLSTASRVGILDTQLTLELPDDSNIVIDDLNLRVENKAGVHQVRMDMKLPPELGDGIEIGADLNGVSNLKKVGGDVYIKAADFKAAGFNRVLSAYDINLPALEALAERGTNAELELWAQVDKGSVDRVNGRTAIGQSAVDDPTADSLFGDLLWVRNDDGGWRFSATDVGIGRRGSETTFDEIHLGTAVKSAYRPQWIVLRTADTQVQPVVNTVTKLLPSAVPAAVNNWLETASLSASIRRAEMQMSLLNRESFSLVAQLDNTSWLPGAQHPGASIESMDINIVNGRGQLSMSPQTVKIIPPTPNSLGVSETVEPLQFEPLELEQVAWSSQIDLPNRSLKGGLSIKQLGAQVALRHSFAMNDENDTEIDVQGQFAADSVFDIKTWFTQAWMPPAARGWLENALQGGQVRNGTIEVVGTLDDLKDQSGASDDRSTIRAEFDAVNAKLQFLETWPAATSVNAHLVFDRTSLTAQASSGRLAGLPVDNLVARIDNLLDAELILSAVSNATLDPLTKFAATGPLKNILQPVLGDAEVDGNARVEVELEAPLRLPVNFREGDVWPVEVDGNVFLQNSKVKLAAVDLPFENVRGAIGFDEKGVLLKTVKATLFGFPVRLNAATTGDGSDRRTDIAVRGVLPARPVLERYEIVGAEYLSGNSSWRADASVPHDVDRLDSEGIALTITSDLVGTSISLSEPLGKRSVQKLPLRVSTRFRQSDVENNIPQVWRLRFGTSDNVVNDVRVSVTEEGMEGMVMSLGASLGDKQPGEGIRVMGATDVISLDGMVEDIADIIDLLSDPESEEEPTLILPVSMDVYGRKLRAGDTLIGDVSIKVNTDDKFSNLYINNPFLRGSIRYPREHWRKDIDAKVRLNYASRVLLDALTETEDEEEELVERLDPTTLPPIDMHISRFDWDQLILQNVVVRTEPDAAGLRVRTLGFATGTTQLIGEGLWHLVDPQNVNPNLANAHRAQLHMTLQSSNFGRALDEFGYPGLMANGEGNVTVSMNWPDALYAPGLEKVAGLASLDIRRGQLLQVDPGAGRLVGLFSLQTLPRRFNLNFDDLVREGLDFSTINGEIAMESGVADIRLVQLNGAVGVIDITGTSNLVTQELNQRVTVLPRVSAALPIIGVISGGATAGVGALIAGGILKGLGVDFDRLGLRQYSITGSFETPVIEQN